MVEHRLGVVALPITLDGRVLLMPGGSENNGKFERVPLIQPRLMSSAGSEFPAGAVEIVDIEPGFDWMKLAILREIAEETGMIVSPDRLVELPENLLVEQDRKGQMTTFIVASYWLQLTEAQEKHLITQGAREVGVVQEIRPRDVAIIELFFPTRVSVEENQNA